MDSLGPHKVISILGNAKNAGKTTTLNYLLSCVGSYGVTSIGMDGEKLDTLTDLPKPKIRVKAGSLVSTVDQALRQVTFTYTVLHTFAFHTPLGSVLLIQVNQDCELLVAGPSKVSELKEVMRVMQQYPLDNIFIDGAFGRMAQGNPYLADGIVLAIGASFSHDEATLVSHTKNLIALLQLPQAEPFICAYAKQRSDIAWWDASNTVTPLAFDSVIQDEAKLKDLDFSLVKGIYFPKAIAKSMMEFLSTITHQIDIVMHNPTHVVLDKKGLALMQKLPHRFFAVHPVNLLAITINPVSPGKHFYDKDTLLKAIQTGSPVKVYNVCEEGFCE